MFFERFKRLAKENTEYRKVVYTGKYGKLVLRMVSPFYEGKEVQSETDQLLYFVDGKGKMSIHGKREDVNKNAIVFIPAGVRHTIFNREKIDLKFFSVYAPL